MPEDITTSSQSDHKIESVTSSNEPAKEPKKAKGSDKKLFILLLVIFALLIIGGGYYVWSMNRFDPQRYAELIEEGDHAYDSMEYSVALDNYISATELAPRQYEAYSKMVMVLVDKGRFSDAENIINGVIVHLDPVDYAKLWNDLGEGYQRAQRYQEAASAYENAYKYDGEQIYLVKLIDSAYRSGLIDLAQQYLPSVDSDVEQVVLMWQEYKGVLDEKKDLINVVTLAKKYIEDGYTYLASDVLLQYEDDMANYWEGQYYLGRALYEEGKPAEAIKYFEAAVSLGSDHPTLYLYLGRSYKRQAEKNTAYNFYDRAVSFAGDTELYDFVDEYLELLIEDSQKTKATDLLSSYSDRDWSSVLWMEFYWKNNDLNKMYEIYEEVEETNIPVNKMQLVRIMVSDYYLSGDNEYDKAERMITSIEDSAWRYLYLGYLAKEKGDRSDALLNYNRAIDVDLVGNVTEIAKKAKANL